LMSIQRGRAQPPPGAGNFISTHRAQWEGRESSVYGAEKTFSRSGERADEIYVKLRVHREEDRRIKAEKRVKPCKEYQKKRGVGL